MDDSAIRGPVVNSSDGGVGNRRVSKICVEGYDTSLRQYCLRLALKKHFASCGLIKQVYIPRDFKRGILKTRAYITICGEGALEKALELSGTDVGGWTVFVSNAPRSHTEITDPGRRPAIKNIPPHAKLVVTGFDTSLAKLDIEIGLSRYFSSCGDIISILVRKDARCSTGTMGTAAIYIEGEGAADNAKTLSGSNVGGWKIDVVQVTFPLKNSHMPVVVGYTLDKLAHWEKKKKEKERKKKKEKERMKKMYN